MADFIERVDKAAASSSPSTRKVKAPEERQKRGRWVLPTILLGSVLVSLWFWFS